MTTGRINQVACRAARAPIHHTRWSTGASTTRSATDRATDRRETRAQRWKTTDARATRTEPRWLQHVRAQCKMWVGVARATALSREQPRAPPKPETTRYKERAAASRRTESPLRPAEHPLATRGAQHTQIMQGRTDDTPHWQGSQPEQPGRCASTKPSEIKAAAARWAMLCRAIRTATQGSRRTRPLHALACTRRLRTVAKPITQLQNALARARIAPHGTKRARPPHIPKHRATRCRAPRASCCPLDIWPRRKPAAPSVAPRRRLAPSGAGARTICHEMGRANSRARARCSPATGFDSDASSQATAQPSVARLHTRCCTFGAPRRALHEKKKHCPPSVAACAHVPTGAVCVCACVCAKPLSHSHRVG